MIRKFLLISETYKKYTQKWNEITGLGLKLSWQEALGFEELELYLQKPETEVNIKVKGRDTDPVWEHVKNFTNKEIKEKKRKGNRRVRRKRGRGEAERWDEVKEGEREGEEGRRSRAGKEEDHKDKGQKVRRTARWSRGPQWQRVNLEFSRRIKGGQVGQEIRTKEKEEASQRGLVKRRRTERGVQKEDKTPKSSSLERWQS